MSGERSWPVVVDEDEERRVRVKDGTSWIYRHGDAYLKKENGKHVKYFFCECKKKNGEPCNTEIRVSVRPARAAPALLCA